MIDGIMVQATLKNYAINNGSGLTGCGACKDRALQNACMWRRLKSSGLCTHIIMEEYCDSLKAQDHAKGKGI